MTDAPLQQLIQAIASADDAKALGLLAAEPGLARQAVEAGATRAASADNYLSQIEHYVYAGDTALHVAAAAYRPTIVRKLVELGADVRAKNRRGAAPLHYAADGLPGSPGWNPAVQAETIADLIAAGADPNAIDKGCVTPLHRAVRTRCAAAVAALLDGGANPERRNLYGTSPLELATRATGRGGSGSAEARAEQAEIVRLFGRYSAAPAR